MTLQEAIREFNDPDYVEYPGKWDGPRRDAAVLILKAVANGVLTPASPTDDLQDKAKIGRLDGHSSRKTAERPDEVPAYIEKLKVSETLLAKQDNKFGSARADAEHWHSVALAGVETIDKLRTEKSEAEAKLAQAEREREAWRGEATGFSVKDYHDGKSEGFHAGIEAAAELVDKRKSILEVGTELSSRIRNLSPASPTDTVRQADHELNVKQIGLDFAGKILAHYAHPTTAGAAHEHFVPQIVDGKLSTGPISWLPSALGDAVKRALSARGGE